MTKKAYIYIYIYIYIHVYVYICIYIYTSINDQTTYKRNQKFDRNGKCLVYLITCDKCLKQYVGKRIDMFRSR